MRIKKAVIPIAGLGTRLFPASFACKKELFPVIAPDGIARPMLHIQVMDLIEAGIEQICLVVSPGEQKSVVDYFSGPNENYFHRLNKLPQLEVEVYKMRDALNRMSFVEQTTQEGFGHAVWMSKTFAAGDPILLCLGDHLFRGQAISPHRQMIDIYTRYHGQALSAVNRIQAEDLKGYGVIAGKRLTGDTNLIAVDRIVEKPSLVEAAHLHVDGLNPGDYLGWFGMHILPPAIFDVLDCMIAGNDRQNGEFQLTYAQELLRQRQGYLACELVEATRYDFGTPLDFVKSIEAYYKGI